MWRETLTVLLALGTTATVAVAQSSPVSRYEDESLLAFRTSEVVPRDLLAGPNYELDAETRLEGGRFVFRIDTKWGVLTAHGKPMLAVRLREMDAVERAKSMSKEPQLAGAFLDTLVDSKDGAKLLLTDPIGTVRRAPKGIGRTIKGVVDPANRKSGGETRRRLAAELGCDPETDNPILDELLDWIAVRQKVGGIAGKASMNLVAPGLALIPTTAQFKELLATRSPAEINQYVERQLVEAGYDAELAKRFVRADGPTTMQRLMMLERLTPLAGVTGRDALLRRAAAAETMADGMALIHELMLVDRLRESDGITRIEDPGYLLVTRGDGSQVVVCTAGYRVHDRSLQTFATACRAAAREPLVLLYGPVQLSDRAAYTLKEAGIERIEASNPNRRAD